MVNRDVSEPTHNWAVIEYFTQGGWDNVPEIGVGLWIDSWTLFHLPWFNSLMHAGSISCQEQLIKPHLGI